jgi:hypothetical protein
LFRNGSVTPPAAERSDGFDAAKTGRKWWRFNAKNALSATFGHLACGNGPDRLLQNRYFAQARMNVDEADVIAQEWGRFIAAMEEG